MTSILRKHLEIPLPSGDTVGVEVTMRVAEIVERVWDKSIDAVIVDLTSDTQVKRSLVAEVIAQWVAPSYPQISRRELKESIMRSGPEAFGAYAGLVLLASMYCVSHVDDDGFDQSSKGVLAMLTKSKKKADEPATEQLSTRQKKAGGRRASQSKRTT